MKQKQYLMLEDAHGAIRPIEIEASHVYSDEELLPGTATESFPISWLEVDIGALDRNIQRLQKVIGPDVGTIAVAKSDGYGHGLVPIAHTLASSNIDIIGVGSAVDAHRLREEGIKQRILVLYPVLPAQIPNLVRDQVDITVTSLESIQTAEQASKRLKIHSRLHIHVETGMHYYGMDQKIVPALAKKIYQSPSLKLVGISTHFATAETNQSFAERQFEELLTVLKQLKENDIYPEMVHTANSAALDNLPGSFDPSVYRRIFPQVQVLIRVGCLLYGTYRPRKLNLVPEYVATSLVSRILEVKKINKHDTVGYFMSYVTDKPREIAIVPLGWGSNGFLPIDGQAIANGTCVPILGLVSANTFAIDVTNLNVKVGDKVKLFDESANSSIRLGNLAAKQGMFVNRLIAVLGASSSRVYIRT